MKKILFLTMLLVSHFYGLLGMEGADKAAFISTFFSHAQEQMPELETAIRRLAEDPSKNEKEFLEKQALLELYCIIDMIAQRNVDQLTSVDAEHLRFSDGQVWVPGSQFDSKFVPTEDPRLFTCALLGGGNALAFVLFNSARDKTVQDKKDTLAMIQLLLGKGLDPNAYAGIAYFIKNSLTSTGSADYPRVMSLLEVAKKYSDPEAAELVRKHIAQNRDTTI